MLEAIELAKKGEFSVQPNPMVGCIITKGNKVIGRGWHKKYGSHHAEVNAVRSCLRNYGAAKGKRLLNGSTMFVTLEPCSITNNTPPCTNTILQYGIAKVVYGAKDPNPKIFGKGLKLLKANGIDIEVSRYRKECQDLLKIFAINQTQNRPFVTLKIALTKDGFLGPKNAKKQFLVSGPKSRANVQSLRKKHKAVLIGGNTLRIDRPSLHLINKNIADSAQPVKIIITNKNITSVQLRNLTNRFSKILLVSNKKINFPKKQNIENIIIAKTGKHFFNILFKELLHRNISSVLVEPGQGLFTLFQKYNLLDELIVFQSPKVLGDGLRPMKSKENFENLLNGLTLLSSEKCGADIKSTYKT